MPDFPNRGDAKVQPTYSEGRPSGHSAFPIKEPGKGTMRNSDERTAPLQAAFPKRFPEMVSARRSYGNDRRARSGAVKHTIVVRRQVGRPELPQSMRATCDKPCRFVRLCGNQSLEVFRHRSERPRSHVRRQSGYTLRAPGCQGYGSHRLESRGVEHARDITLEFVLSMTPPSQGSS